MKELYKLQKQASDLDLLGNRQLRLLQSAINYHSLINANQVIEFKIYMGEKWQYPHLTDDSTIDGSLTSKMGLHPISTCTAQTNNEHTPAEIIPDNSGPMSCRHILLTPEDSTSADVEANRSTSAAQKIYSYLEKTFPVLFDEIREKQRCRRESTWYTPVEQSIPSKWINGKSNAINFAELIHPEPDSKREKAVLVGMHWLEAGGAERWALETVTLANNNGLLPIVITDHDSQHPWITNPAFDNALVLPLTFPIQEKENDEPLLRVLFSRFDIRGVLVHHCQWLYDRLYWIKFFYPDCQIVDSTHILEYRDCGGFPHQSVSHDEYIDIHHVISPQLEEWMTRDHGIDREKVVDAPLLGLTTDQLDPSYKERSEEGKLTVAYVGRIARQKRPESFVLLARKLKQVNAGYSVIMHGSGEEEHMLDYQIHRFGLDDYIIRRGEDIPVEETLRDSDVLVVSAINEGITLTSIEAITAGIPVVSTNVGSQRTLIPSSGLVERSTSKFVEQTVSILERLRTDEASRRSLWTEEHLLLKKFSKLESANSYFSHLMHDWSIDE